jgi:hypothetical protein
MNEFLNIAFELLLKAGYSISNFFKAKEVDTSQPVHVEFKYNPIRIIEEKVNRNLDVTTVLPDFKPWGEWSSEDVLEIKKEYNKFY